MTVSTGSETPGAVVEEKTPTKTSLEEKSQEKCSSNGSNQTHQESTGTAINDQQVDTSTKRRRSISCPFENFLAATRFQSDQSGASAQSISCRPNRQDFYRLCSRLKTLSQELVFNRFIPNRRASYDVAIFRSQSTIAAANSTKVDQQSSTIATADGGKCDGPQIRVTSNKPRVDNM